MNSPPSRPSLLALIVTTALSVSHVSGAARAARAPRVPAGNPTIVLTSPAGERTLRAVDLAFVFYERIYYHKRAPRKEEATGERVDVEDRRRECRCLRLEDWSKMKFKKLRQIEIVYPDDSTVAVLRATQLDGKMNEVRADSMYGAVDSFAPRFAARVDEEIQEFPLIRATGEPWPEERLARILLKRPPPARRGRP